MIIAADIFDPDKDVTLRAIGGSSMVRNISVIGNRSSPKNSGRLDI
jgi:hypothetical protein